MATATSAKVRIAILGAGHMGTALFEGLKKSGVRATLGKRGGIRQAAAAADVVILAVKPGSVGDVLREVSSEIKGKAVVSAAAAVSIAFLKKYAKGARVARIMPNMPVAVNQGVVGFHKGNLSAREAAALREILGGLGLRIDVNTDRELDALTLISGCGPGVVAYLIESLAREASSLGIKGFRAEQVAFQTFAGTAAYMRERLMPASRMRASVATKGGVTEAIVASLKAGGFERTLKKAVSVGKKRIRKIAV